ncbi:MAG: sulfatase-like hydrolase/transferase [Pseudomonadota bacterium]
MRAALPLIALLAVGCTCGPPERDLVLVVVDALRADRLRLDLHPTPALDRLTAEGRVYDRAFTHGIDTVRAMPALLGGLGPRGEDGQPRYLGTRFPRHHRGFFSANAWIGPPLTDGFHDVVQVEYFYGEPRVDGHDLAARFTAWLGAHPEPVLAVLHFMDVHAPYASPCGEGQALTANGPLPQGTPPATLALTRRRYDDGVACFDPILAEVMEAVAARPREVLLVLTADHGESLGERGLLGHGTRVVPEVARVPLVAWTPGGELGRSKEVVGHEIVAPLLAGEEIVPAREVRIQPEAVVRWPRLMAREATFDLEAGEAKGPTKFHTTWDDFPEYEPPAGAAGGRGGWGYTE